MLRFARFAFLAGLTAAIPAVVALDPPQAQDKQQTKDDNKKKVEPAKPAPKEGAADDRIARRNSRMKERNREIDRMLNKPKK
jgi:hypothetical protein